MAWAQTVIVKGCASNTPIAGALVSDGVSGGYTDGYGQFTAIIDDAYSQYIVTISKSGYVSRYFTFNRATAGTTQNTCLDVYVAPPSTGGNGGGCFIVTAATGSEESEEVTTLRALRERVSATAPVAGQLIDAIYEEYWQFSPAIADRIRESSSARMGVMMVVVRPLFTWYQLAGRLALEPTDGDAIGHAERELRAACPGYLSSRVASFLDAMAHGEPLPATGSTLAGELAPRLQEAMALPLVRWAIFDPLVRTWRGAAERRDMRREVAEWLAAAPVEVLASPLPWEMDRELASVRSLLSFDADAREQLEDRLRTAWRSPTTASHGAGSLTEAR